MPAGRPEDLGAANDAAENDRMQADDRYSPEADANARDLIQVVTDELGRMSEKNRIAYILLREEGLNVKEAAALLGYNKGCRKSSACIAPSKQISTALGAAGWK